VVVPNEVLFRKNAAHDSRTNLSPLPLLSENPARVTSGPFDVVRVRGRPPDEILNTASASFLLTAATISISLDKMSH
jgi:hypothetical protein